MTFRVNCRSVLHATFGTIDATNGIQYCRLGGWEGSIIVKLSRLLKCHSGKMWLSGPGAPNGNARIQEIVYNTVSEGTCSRSFYLWPKACLASRAKVTVSEQVLALHRGERFRTKTTRRDLLQIERVGLYVYKESIPTAKTIRGHTLLQTNPDLFLNGSRIYPRCRCGVPLGRTNLFGHESGKQDALQYSAVPTVQHKLFLTVNPILWCPRRPHYSCGTTVFSQQLYCTDDRHMAHFTVAVGSQVPRRTVATLEGANPLTPPDPCFVISDRTNSFRTLPNMMSLCKFAPCRRLRHLAERFGMFTTSTLQCTVVVKQS